MYIFEKTRGAGMQVNMCQKVCYIYPLKVRLK